jgi:hypothetical protein
MMNIDVTVKLIDQLSRQAKAPTEALTKFAAAAKKFSGSSAKEALSNIRGVSRALQGLDRGTNGAKGAASSLDRLATAFGALAGHSAGIRGASSAIGSFNRSIGKIDVTRVNAAAKSIRAFNKAMSAAPPPGGGGAGNINTELNRMLRLQARAIANMRTLNGGGQGGGYGGGRRGMGSGGGGRHGLGMYMPKAHSIARPIFTESTSLEDAQVRMRGKGLTQGQIDAVNKKAMEVTKAVSGTTPLSNVNAIMEGYVAMGGDLKKSLNIVQDVVQIGKIAAYYNGSKDRGKGAASQIYEMERAGELRGSIQDTTAKPGEKSRFRKQLEDMLTNMVFTDGKLTAADFHKNILYGRSAMQSVSDGFLARSGFLMQEMKTGSRGGQTGVALQSLYKTLVLSVTKLSNLKEWRRLNFVDESKVDKDKNGKDIAMHPGAITLDKLAMSDPDLAVNKLTDRMREMGIRDRGAILQEYAGLVGTGTGQTAVDILGLQRERMEMFQRARERLLDVDTLNKDIDMTASQSTDNLQAKMNELAGNVGTSVIPMFTSLVQAAGKFIGVINAGTDTTGNDPTKAGGGFNWFAAGGILTTLGVGLSQLAVRFPVIGNVITTLAAAGGCAGFLSGVVSSLVAGPMARVFAAIARLGTAGFWQVAIASIVYSMADKLIHLTPAGKVYDKVESALAGPKLETMRDVNFADRARRFIFGGFGDMVSAFTAPSHNDAIPAVPLHTDELQPLAGHRALGGPVDRQKSYLVGERGPEIFTPGIHGGITSNRMMSSLAGGGGDDKSSKEIRYLSFALASSVDHLTGAVARLGTHVAEGVVNGGGGGGARGAGSTDHGAVASGVPYQNGGRFGFMHRGGSGGGHAGHGGVGVAPDGTPMPESKGGAGHTDASSFKGLLFRGESAGNPGIYNYKAGGKYRAGHFDSDKMTIGDLMQRQKAGSIFAAGKYQMIPGTLAEGVRKLGLKSSDKFDSATQDRLFTDYLAGSKRPAISSFVTGKGGLLAAQRAASYEWASVGDPDKGGTVSHYGKDHASISPAQMAAGLQKARAQYVELMKQPGMNPETARRAALLGILDPKHTDAVAKAASSPLDRVPEILREQGKKREIGRDNDARNQATGGDTHNHFHGDVNIPVHAHQAHSPAHIADAVHARFNRAVQTQLNDGAYA